MTPAARYQAAIEILDHIIDGTAAEKALTGWGRRSRYAGSGDRAAVRDHVFEAVRRMRSDAALGGGRTGRGLILGALRRTGVDPEAVFSGIAYSPVPLSDAERDAGGDPQGVAETLDMPDWLMPAISDSLGVASEPAAKALQSRAPVHLRVNLAKADLGTAVSILGQEGVICAPHPACDTALEVTEGSRRVRQTAAYRDGLVELQDAASQAVVQALPLKDGMRVLDYCAGGGGKALAMAARARIELFVHDIEPARMRDLPDRAERAGITVTELATQEVSGAGPFDLVLCDAPCSGSGAWRRAPEGKWRLTPEQLEEFVQIQADILRKARDLTAPGGVVAYATCSLLNVENRDQIAGFLRENPGWQSPWSRAWAVEAGTDGFFAAHLTRED
jgi:16S rRNA (cytosine967-C5)-methyltransferase